MADDGETKDDVKVPDGEVGEKIDKLFTTEEKDTSKIRHSTMIYEIFANLCLQTLSFSLPWVSRLPLKPRRLPAVRLNTKLNTTTSTLLSSMAYPLRVQDRSTWGNTLLLAVDSFGIRCGACILMVDA